MPPAARADAQASRQTAPRRRRRWPIPKRPPPRVAAQKHDRPSAFSMPATRVASPRRRNDDGRAADAMRVILSRRRASGRPPMPTRRASAKPRDKEQRAAGGPEDHAAACRTRRGSEAKSAMASARSPLAAPAPIAVTPPPPPAPMMPLPARCRRPRRWRGATMRQTCGCRMPPLYDAIQYRHRAPVSPPRSRHKRAH